MFYFFNWKITALQCCVGFCYTKTRISHKCICMCVCVCVWVGGCVRVCIHSLLSFLPMPSRPNPYPALGHHKAPGWDPCYTTDYHQLAVLHWQCIYLSMLLSQFAPSSPSPAMSTSLFYTQASLFLPSKRFISQQVCGFLKSICYKTGIDSQTWTTNLRLLLAQLVNNPPAMQETRFDSWVGKIPWRRDRLPTPLFLGFPCGSAGKESTCNVEDLGLIPGLGRSPGEGKNYLLQYSGLENSTDFTVHQVTKSQTQLSNFHFERKGREE